MLPEPRPRSETHRHRLQRQTAAGVALCAPCRHGADEVRVDPGAEAKSAACEQAMTCRLGATRRHGHQIQARQAAAGRSRGLSWALLRAFEFLCPVRGKKLAPPQVSAEVLRKMKKTAEDYLGEEVTKRSSRCRPTSTRAVKFSMPRTVDDRLGRIRCGTPAHRAGRDRYGPPVPPPVGILLHCWFNDACTRPERDSPLAVLAADSWLGGLGVRSIL